MSSSTSIYRKVIDWVNHGKLHLDGFDKAKFTLTSPFPNAIDELIFAVLGCDLEFDAGIRSNYKALRARIILEDKNWFYGPYGPILFKAEMIKRGLKL